MDKFTQEALDVFKASAIRHGFWTEADFPREAFAGKIENWASNLILSQHHIPNEDNDRLFVFRPAFLRYDRNRRENRRLRVKVFIVAIQGKNQTIKILSQSIVGNKFDYLKDGRQVHELVKSPRFPFYDCNENPDGLEIAMANAVVSGANALLRKTLTGSRHMTVREQKRFSEKADTLIGNDMREFLREKFNDFNESWQSLLDRKAFDFARKCVDKNKGNAAQGALALYNHIVGAKAGIARDYRCGALSALVPAGYLFLDNIGMWAKIDSGSPLYDMLSERFTVSKSVFRHLFQLPTDVKRHFEQTQLYRLLPHLDALDVSLWPKTAGEASFFVLSVTYARMYSETFNLRAREVLRDLTKGNDFVRSDERWWRKFFYARLETQNQNLSRQRAEAGDGRKITDADLLSQFSDDLRDIGDMCADVNKRLLLPLLLLEFQKSGYEVTSVNGIPQKELQAKFWSYAPPSEHISASSYWHSSRVDMQARFQSAAFASTQSGWKGLINEDYRLKFEGGEILFVPLNSDAALREEGVAMSHCVGSYTYRCIKDEYHILSLRDEKGHRGSTLACREVSASADERRVSIIQNRAYYNQPPTPLMASAAAEFVRLINDGEIRVDWNAIADSKAALQVNDVDAVVGYNYRDPAQLQRVLQVYKPMIPRKLIGLTHCDPEMLAKELGVGEVVLKYLQCERALRPGEIIGGSANRPRLRRITPDGPLV